MKHCYCVAARADPGGPGRGEACEGALQEVLRGGAGGGRLHPQGGPRRTVPGRSVYGHRPFLTSNHYSHDNYLSFWKILNFK